MLSPRLPSLPVLGLVVAACLPASENVSLADAPEAVEDAVYRNELAFWDAYNNRDVNQVTKFLTEDVEFYHDKGGFTKTPKALAKDLASGIFSPGEPSIRRELIQGTLQTHEIPDYGAIVLGQHRFFVTIKGQPERNTSTAQFTHLWKQSGSKWQMSRVLSFDHQAVEIENSVSLTPDQLKTLVGAYITKDIGPITVSIKDQSLFMKADGFESPLVALSESTFQHPHRDLTFQFEQNPNGKIDSLTVKEHGQIVQQAKRRD